MFFELGGELLLLIAQLCRLFGNLLRQRFFAFRQTRYFAGCCSRVGRGHIPLALKQTDHLRAFLELAFETFHPLA
jgi:hypothetical protein